MSDISYRYGVPREEVHYKRYGTTEVPQRRGMGGAVRAKITAGQAIAVMGGIAVLVGLILIYKGR